MSNIQRNIEHKRARRKYRQNHRDLTGLPCSAVIRLPDVLRIYPVSKSHWWDGIKKGIYPAPVKLGVRARGWRLGEVLALTKQDINGEVK